MAGCSLLALSSLKNYPKTRGEGFTILAFKAPCDKWLALTVVSFEHSPKRRELQPGPESQDILQTDSTLRGTIRTVSWVYSRSCLAICCQSSEKEPGLFHSNRVQHGFGPGAGHKTRNCLHTREGAGFQIPLKANRARHNKCWRRCGTNVRISMDHDQFAT